MKRQFSFRLYLAFASSLFLVISNGCVYDAETAIRERAPFDENKESSAIYSIVINNEFPIKDNSLPPRVLFISDSTYPLINLKYFQTMGFEQRVEFLKNWFPHVDQQTLESYEEKFGVPVRFSDDLVLNLERDHKFVDQAEIDGATDEAERHRILVKNRVGSVIYLSSIGFNNSRNQAFMCMKYLYCPLCSFSKYYTLEKSGDTWTIVDVEIGMQS